MTHWIDDYAPLHIMHKQLDAGDYNAIRVVMLRERLPLEVHIKDFRCLLFILDEAAWICIDECQNNLPVLAWTNFKTAHRSALNAPVECELRLYHMHAGLVMGPVLEGLVKLMTQQGSSHSGVRHPVSQLKR